jgi:hypothetical protein
VRARRRRASDVSSYLGAVVIWDAGVGHLIEAAAAYEAIHDDSANDEDYSHAENGD